ncbi:MAG: penicillin-binding protein 2 [Chitinispirillaceae bacterium]|jgi:penicillin-binding protein 2
MPYLYDEQQERNAKSRYLIIAVALFFSILIVRLMYLQVIQADLNIRLSKENSMRLKIILPPRGYIYDRRGEVLARNRPSYSLCVLPSQLKHRKEVVHRLCAIRDSTGDAVFDSMDLEATIRKAFGRKFDPTRIKEDISFDLMSIVEEHSMELPGIMVVAESRREYPLGPDAFHVLGYMGEIPEKDFDTLKQRGYYYGDLIGTSGIERQYEKDMRGVCGQEYIEVDAYGKSLGPLPDIPKLEAVPGNNLFLTLDARLQRTAARVFPDSMKGAVVALDPRTGEVLVMFSNPSIDPNIFSMAGSVRSQNWNVITADTSLPLNNRATSGTYAPGSTFKLVSALAGLETGQLTAASLMPAPCRGIFRFGSRIAHCWEEKGHGRLNLIEAIQQSCDVYFYQVGLRVEDAAINRYAVKMGLGSMTGIDLPGEKEGWLSGEDAYNKKFKSKGWVWTKGLLLDLAIGQAQVVTPLQLALMIGGMGNGRALYRPFLVREEKNHRGITVKRHAPAVLDSLAFKVSTIETMHTAMQKVLEEGGTGGMAAVPGVPVGGKTGSAQNPQGEKTHALFIACAPVDNPVIAIAVVVENAGHGGSIAAPIAGTILRYYFAETEEGKEVVAKYKKRLEH